MVKKIICDKLIICMLILTCNGSLYASYFSDRKVKRIEHKGDKQFIKGDFSNAFKSYQKSYALLSQDSIKRSLMDRKLGRLYTLLLRYDLASIYYSGVYNTDPYLLSVEDVCRYIDALRQNNEEKKAEIVCRTYAFDENYSQNQMYLNILQSLTYDRHYYHMGDEEYSVNLLPVNTDKAEYWVGKYKGNPFYGLSNSYMQDPQKIYYHQNLYYSFIDTVDRQIQFPFIPRDLQNGPISFSEKGDAIVVTANQYNGMDQIGLPYESEQIYRTNLYISYFDKKKSRWSKFKPLFSDKEKASYAHPYFANNDQTLFFASNRSGGHGGMDIYRIDRISDTKWSNPVNMGPVINTEGNELYPVADHTKLSFSSNGHAGFGGYDIYSAELKDQKAQKGTIYHYPYPINTVFNDFGLNWFNNHGYLISDRHNHQDDIYSVSHQQSLLLSKNESSYRLNKDALEGQSDLINGYNKNIQSSKATFNGNSELYQAVHEGDILLSVYFDFDSSDLDPESISQIQDLVNSKTFQFIKEIQVIGYADELGTDYYNYVLSEQRAKTIADFLLDAGKVSRISYEGKGKLYFSTDMLNQPISQSSKYREYNQNLGVLSLREKIRQLKPARRVDIIVRKMNR